MELRINPRTLGHGAEWRRVVLHRLTGAERAALDRALPAAGLFSLREARDAPYSPLEISGPVDRWPALVDALRSARPELAGLLERTIGARRPAVFRHARGTLPLERPLLMGVINVTPDSFSDGGDCFDATAAIEHGLALAEQGADLLDVGGESTRPGALPVEAGEETDRVLPVIEGLARRCGLPLSIDTAKARVAREALARGAAVVNDVTGLQGDPEMARVAAEAGAGLVLMHMQGAARTMQQDPHYDDLLYEVTRCWREGLARAAVAGIQPDQVLLDPGIGFGKTLDHNLELLRRLPELASLGHGLLIGTSRKSFIKAGLESFWPATPTDCAQGQPKARVWGTAASVACAVAAGAVALRVHDVAAMRQVADLAHLIARTG